MSGAVELEYLGGHGHSHGSEEVEAEYDRLRALAREEAHKRGECFEQSQAAYTSGDGAGAKELSNRGKEHGARMAEYNRQASEYIFAENNADGRVEPDEIDLHGQFVEEAEDILEERIKAGQQRGEDHLHVIVGKGIHSVHHVQKIKPAVEKVCDRLGLNHRVEHNAGRIYVNLTGGPADPLEDDREVQYESPQGPQVAPQHGGQQQQQPQQEESTLDSLCKGCCIVM